MIKAFISRCSVLLLALSSLSVNAAEYPDRPVTIIVGTAAGGTADMVARIIAQGLTERFGKSFIVENRPGAGNVIGTVAAARAKPDGYTLLLGTSSSLTVNPAIYSNLPYDPVRDFQPISLLAFSRIVVVASAKVPVDSFSSMIEYVRARPGQANYATPGNGTTHHLAGEMLKSMAGLDMTAIPYKGSVPALTDVISGTVPFMLDNLNTSMAQARAGKVKVLAVTSQNRSEGAPDVPTVAESGLPGFDISAWVGLLGPAGIPEDVVAKLNAAAIEILKKPEVRQRFLSGGLDSAVGTPDEFAKQIETELERYRSVIKTAKIKFD